MLDDLRSLAVFAKIVELGSFRAAARELRLSPSVVSHHLKELEGRLSLPLLYRSTRRLALTPDGERLLTSAREMVDAAARGLDAMSGRSDVPKGALRVAVPAFLGETKLCHDLAAFSSAHPQVRLTVSFSDTPSDLLRDGFDLAIRAGRLEESSHKSRKLAEMPRLLVASSRYVASKTKRDSRVPCVPRDVADWDFVKLSSRPAEVSLSSPGKKPVVLSFEPKLSVDSAAAMRELVLAGAGLATVPEVIVREDLRKGRLVDVLPEWRPQTVGVFALWPDNAQRARLTSRFLEFMAARTSALFAMPAP